MLDSEHNDSGHFRRIRQALKENGYWQGEIWDTRKTANPIRPGWEFR